MKNRAVFAASIIAVSFSIAAFAADQSPWENWRSLIGTWEAEGQGDPGNGAGTFSFSFDLQNKILVRKSHTDYPPANSKPAFAHDDLMIVYREDRSDKTRADYFDNEGHVIRYIGTVSSDAKTITLLSESQPGQPVFRLTYEVTAPDQLAIKFEIAPPDKPQDFKTYVQGRAHKRA